MIGTGWDVRINNIYIKASIPEGATKEDIRVFGHGPLTGESEITDSRNVEFKVPAVSAGTFVETRVMFPNKLVPDSKNIVPKDALQDILTHEKKLAEEANLERERAREYVKQQQEKQKGCLLLVVLFSILLPLWFVIIIYVYLKYDREFRHSFSVNITENYRRIHSCRNECTHEYGQKYIHEILCINLWIWLGKGIFCLKLVVDRKSLLGLKLLIT